MPSGMVWNIVRTAATKIPWGRIVENAPVVVDLVERVKDHLKSPQQNDIYKELKLNREEHLKMADSLLQATTEVQQLKAALEVVAARQKMLMIATGISLLVALSALIGWLSR
jgi:hypothetical protein